MEQRKLERIIGTAVVLGFVALFVAFIVKVIIWIF